MEDEIKSDMDTENEDEIEDLTADTTEEDLTAEELKSRLEKHIQFRKEAVLTKKRWRERAIDPNTGKLWSEIAKEKDTLPTKTTPTPTPTNDVSDLAADVRELKVEKEKRHFAYANNLSPEETDFVFSMPVKPGQKREELLNDPFIKGGLETYRQRKAQESATPRPSSRAVKIAGKSVADLSEKELRENWGKITGAEK